MQYCSVPARQNSHRRHTRLAKRIPHEVAYCEVGLAVGAEGDDAADAFVAADVGEFDGGYGGPVRWRRCCFGVDVYHRLQSYSSKERNGRVGGWVATILANPVYRTLARTSLFPGVGMG